MGIRRVNIWIIGVIDFLTECPSPSNYTIDSTPFHASEAVHERVARFALMQIMEFAGWFVGANLSISPNPTPRL